MKKQVAVVAVNPVNGFGLVQYLEAFYENGISFTLFAVDTAPEIKTNSGVSLRTDDVIASLKGRTDQYDAFVFACGDAMPVFSEHAAEQPNQDLLSVIAEFGAAQKLMIGHCVAGLLFEKTGIADGKKITLHPLAQPAIVRAVVSDHPFCVDSNFMTAATETTLPLLIPRIIAALQ